MSRLRALAAALPRFLLLALAGLTLAGCVVEPGYYRPVAYVRPVPHVFVVR